MDIKFHLNIFLRTRNQKRNDILREFFVFWNYNEKGNKKWSGLLHYLFYYTEWWKSQYKRTEQISLRWHGFECNREFLESKFYSLRFPCPFGKPTFSRESSIRFEKQYRTTSKGLRLEIRMEKKERRRENISKQRTN